MPIIRNPFRKPAGDLQPQDENRQNVAKKSPTGSEVDVRTPVEFQLSEIDDSGVFVAPSSPTETKSFWSARSTASTATSNHRSVFNENEPFNISRESFDSYRRSFDISARSPVFEVIGTPPRQSLDSRRLPVGRTSLSFNRGSLDRPPIDRPELREVEEGFKEVDLNDDGNNAKAYQVQPKKRSLFARFGGDSNSNNSGSNDAQASASGDGSRPSSSHHFGLSSFTGRKRGQSGNGAELRSMPRGDNVAMPTEIKVDS